MAILKSDVVVCVHAKDVATRIILRLQYTPAVQYIATTGFCNGDVHMCGTEAGNLSHFGAAHVCET